MTEQCLHYTRAGSRAQRIATVDSADHHATKIGDKVTVRGVPVTVTAIHGTVPALSQQEVRALLADVVAPRLTHAEYAEYAEITGMAVPLTDDSIFSERLAPETEWAMSSGRDGGAW